MRLGLTSEMLGWMNTRVAESFSFPACVTSDPA